MLSVDAEEIAPARLDVIGPDGRTRTLAVSRIRAGGEGGELNQGRSELPGFAVDRAGNRAFLVGGDGLVAAVDLGTLAVSYRPQAHAKQASGPLREAAWLDGIVAVTGYDASIGANGAPATRPYGLRFWDTRTGDLRTIDERASRLAVGAGLVLAYGGETGLTAYRPDGTPLWHLFGETAVDRLVVAAADAYVWAGGAVHAVELAAGAVRARRLRTGPIAFLSRES